MATDSVGGGPVFYDPSHRRGQLFRRIVAVLAALFIVWVAVFAVGLYYVARVPNENVLAAQGGALAAALRPVPPMQTAPAPVPNATPPAVCSMPVDSNETGPTAATGGGSGTRTRYVYLPFWSNWTYASFAQNCTVRDVLLAERYEMDLPGGKLTFLNPEPDHQPRIAQRLKTDMSAMTVLPVLSLGYSGGDTGQINPEQTAARIADAVQRHHYHGLCVAPEGFSDTGLDQLHALLFDLSRQLHARGLTSCLISAAEDGLWQDRGLVGTFDKMVVQAFRSPSTPEPLAPQDWFAVQAKAIAKAVPKDKLVLGLGSFAMDWQAGAAEPKEIPYAEAMRRAGRRSAAVHFDPASRNSTVDYSDLAGATHRIWMLDAATTFNQLTIASKLGISNIGLWSLGEEDPGVWQLLNAGMPLAPAGLTTVSLQNYVGYEGKGPFQIVASPMQVGRRSVTLDPCTGLVAEESYPTVPEPYTIERFGHISPKKIALTFDDGPDPKYTPQIVDVLLREKAPATFFMVGDEMMKFPGVAARVVRDGFEVGSHTFLHGHFETASPLQQRLELNAVQRLLVALTGRGTVLFRFPYEDGIGPMTSVGGDAMSVLKARGYVAVTGSIDTSDWKRPPPQKIVDTTFQQLKMTGGNVVLLHDGGGDRAATVAALPELILRLRREGYQLVPLSGLLGVNRDVIMPPEAGTRTVFDQVTFGFIGQFWNGLGMIFWVVIFLGLGRMTVLVCLALLRQRKPSYTVYTPSVTVVVPAYNEEAVIVRTVQAVQASSYPDLDVIVVDDGSTDHTYERLAAVYPAGGRVTVIRQPNQGKWKALDTAYGLVSAEIVVAIDSDTLVAPDAIEKLVQPFRNPEVGAVAGNVKVGNRNGLLTRLQALEYITSQNIDRRAAEYFGGIMVVPGAIGAWRAEAVREVRLYSNDTLAEDADLTVALHRAGYRIAYREDALSYTEAPATLKAFMGQRLRWTLGLMQVGWKHRRAIRELRSIGLISMLDLLLFGVVLGLLAPIADLVFLHTTIAFVVNELVGRGQPVPPYPMLVLASYLVLPLADLSAAALAFRMERREDPRLLLLVPLQRFFYRQLLYFTVYRAVLRSISGQLASWGNLVRLGTVRLPGS